MVFLGYSFAFLAGGTWTAESATFDSMKLA